MSNLVFGVVTLAQYAVPDNIAMFIFPIVGVKIEVALYHKLLRL